MNDERCSECGSYGVECDNPHPLEDCGCARCLSHALAEERKKVERLEKKATQAIELRELCLKENDDLYSQIDYLSGLRTWEQERAAIASWLRSVQFWLIEDLSEHIERGEHWSTEGGEP